MDQGKSKFISDRVVLGKSGETFSLSYETITFTDNGHFDIYGNGTLTINSVVNQKDSGICPYEIRVIGNKGEDGHDSLHGEDGASGKNGTSTKVEINIDMLQDNIRVISIGGDGGRGGNGIDGLDGGDGGDAAPEKSMEGVLCDAKGGQGGDGGSGKGKGGDGGDGGKGPTVTIRYGAKAEDAEILTFLKCSAGGAAGHGGKGGQGGKGGKNSDGSRAKDGAPGQSYPDGVPGQAGEPGEIIIRKKEEEHEPENI